MELPSRSGEIKQRFYSDDFKPELVKRMASILGEQEYYHGHRREAALRAAKTVLRKILSEKDVLDYEVPIRLGVVEGCQRAKESVHDALVKRDRATVEKEALKLAIFSAVGMAYDFIVEGQVSIMDAAGIGVAMSTAVKLFDSWSRHFTGEKAYIRKEVTNLEVRFNEAAEIFHTIKHMYPQHDSSDHSTKSRRKAIQGPGITMN